MRIVNEAKVPRDVMDDCLMYFNHLDPEFKKTTGVVEFTEKTVCLYTKGVHFIEIPYSEVAAFYSQQ